MKLFFLHYASYVFQSIAVQAILDNALYAFEEKSWNFFNQVAMTFLIFFFLKIKEFNYIKDHEFLSPMGNQLVWMCPQRYKNVLKVPAQGEILWKSNEWHNADSPFWVPQAPKIQMQHFTCSSLKFNKEK